MCRVATIGGRCHLSWGGFATFTSTYTKVPIPPRHHYHPPSMIGTKFSSIQPHIRCVIFLAIIQTRHIKSATTLPLACVLTRATLTTLYASLLSFPMVPTQLLLPHVPCFVSMKSSQVCRHSTTICLSHFPCNPLIRQTPKVVVFLPLHRIRSPLVRHAEELTPP